MSKETFQTALIANPRSRKARQNPAFISDLKEIFGERGPVFESDDEVDLLIFLQDSAESGVNLIFVCGGDGTLRMVLDQVIKAYGGRSLPKIGVLRGGTMNTVASSLGVGKDPRKTLRRYLEKLDTHSQLPTLDRYLLRVNGSNGFIFVTGGFSNFLDLYYQNPSPTPVWGLYLVIRVFLSRIFFGSLYRKLFSPHSVRIEVDGEESEVSKIASFSAASISDIGFGIRPFLANEAKHQFGYLGLVSVPWMISFYLSRLFFTRKIFHASILQGSAQSIRIRFEEPMKPFLDGDQLKSNREFQLSLGERIECVVP